MADIINLRTARKRRARAETEAIAATNRALHGRTKATKAAEAEIRARLDRTLDGAKLDGANLDGE